MTVLDIGAGPAFSASNWRSDVETRDDRGRSRGDAQRCCGASWNSGHFECARAEQDAASVTLEEIPLI
jgi:hypothetical protein